MSVVFFSDFNFATVILGEEEFIARESHNSGKCEREKVVWTIIWCENV